MGKQTAPDVSRARLQNSEVRAATAPPGQPRAGTDTACGTPSQRSSPFLSDGAGGAKAGMCVGTSVDVRKQPGWRRGCAGDQLLSHWRVHSHLPHHAGLRINRGNMESGRHKVGLNRYGVINY